MDGGVLRCWRVWCWRVVYQGVGGWCIKVLDGGVSRCWRVWCWRVMY